jgi:hypothetical protein
MLQTFSESPILLNMWKSKQMDRILEIVQQALATGYLTVEAENRLRLLLQTTKYGLDDLNAFMILQQSAMAGLVKQESREVKHTQRLYASSSVDS